MSVGFVPLDLERTLTPELTHAFVASRTRRLAPDDRATPRPAEEWLRQLQ